MPFNDLVCPVCEGDTILDDEEQCYYCLGTGYATDEDTESAMFSYEKDW